MSSLKSLPINYHILHANEQYPGHDNTKWTKVFSKTSIQFQSPTCLGEKSVNFDTLLSYEIPELGVLKLEKGIILGPNGWILDQGGYLFPEFSWYGLHIEEMDLSKKKYKVIKLEGSCLSLTSDWSNVNYGHFLLDGFCRLNIFLQAGYSLSNVDYFYCPSSVGSNIRLLKKFGIPIDKCVSPENEIAIQTDILYAPSFPGIRRNYLAWIPQFLKRIIPVPEKPPYRLLYIPRYTTRRILNDNSLIAIAADCGFEIFDPMKSDDSARVFSEASIVVSAHGSALADIAFCQSGTKILELIPSDHIFPYWYTLANAVGMQYFYLIGKSNNERPIMKGPSPYDFYIDESEFQIALKTILKIHSNS